MVECQGGEARDIPTFQYSICSVKDLVRRAHDERAYAVLDEPLDMRELPSLLQDVLKAKRAGTYGKS